MTVALRRSRLLLLLGGSAVAGIAAAGGADKDGDGIANKVDACVDEAEDFDGFRDSDGCPDRDNDGDGVPDSEDSCQLAPGRIGKACPSGERASATNVPTPPGAPSSEAVDTGGGEDPAPDTPSESTDDDGSDTDEACFLTTAVSRQRGLPDDCAELTALRAFRDGWMRGSAEGRADLETYARVAPAIVAAVAARPDAAVVWEVLYQDYLRPILAHLPDGDPVAAHHAYRTMVRDLGDGLGVKTS